MPSPLISTAMIAMFALPHVALAQDGGSDRAITRDNLGEAIDAFMAKGNRAGIVSVVLDGETLHERAYGIANAETGTPATLDTIFGIGSRPIDFTVAAIYLLEKQGVLGLDDRLDKYYPEAPADRAGMTIRHMITGASGLPDFPANDSDWDPDIAWVGRAEFERRTMETPLLFAPGKGDAHSHWAYGLAAAIIERASGQAYAGFLREHFFEPAGMERTGSYGEPRDFAIADFAEGRGIRRGVPNIPPNWGPTSWLVMGSGGMYSTLGDLRRFYDYVAGGDVLEPRHRERFTRPNVQVDGSDRGFELFSAQDEERQDQVYLFLAHGDGPGVLEPILRPMVRFLRSN